MTSSRSRRQQIIREAEGYIELGMYRHAMGSLNRLGSETQWEAHAHYLKGEALRSMERYSEALVELESAAVTVPDDVHIWLAMGWCYKRTGRVDMAIDALNNAHDVEPGDALINYNLACYWSLAGSKLRALEFLSNAFDIDSAYRDLVEGESDFDPIREDPDFLALTSVIV